MRTLLITLVLLSCTAGSCEGMPSQGSFFWDEERENFITRAEFDALKSDLDTVRAERDKLKQQAPTASRDVTLRLPGYPFALVGVERPAGSLGESFDWPEVCFDPQELARWFVPLQRALGGGQKPQRRSP